LVWPYTPFKNILLHWSERKATASLKAAFLHHDEINLWLIQFAWPRRNSGRLFFWLV